MDETDQDAIQGNGDGNDFTEIYLHIYVKKRVARQRIITKFVKNRDNYCNTSNITIRTNIFWIEGVLSESCEVLNHPHLFQSSPNVIMLYLFHEVNQMVMLNRP